MPRHGRMTTERAKDFKGTLRQLLAAMSKYKLSLVVVIVFAVLSTIFNIAGPKILAKATTALATGWIAKLRGVGGIDFAYIGKVLLFLLGMYLLSAAFSFIQGWLMSGLSQKVCYDFRDQISKKINRLPLAYFEKRTVGEVLSRITNDVAADLGRIQINGKVPYHKRRGYAGPEPEPERDPADHQRCDNGRRAHHDAVHQP